MELKQKYTLYISLALFTLFLSFAVIGSGIETEEGRQIVFNSVRQNGVIDAISAVCAACALDIGCILAVTLATHPAVSLLILGASCALRGAALGCTAQLLAVNTASVAGVIYSVVYVLITLLICGYGVLINRNKLSPLTVFCLYMAVSGTIVIVRGLSMLVI